MSCLAAQPFRKPVIGSTCTYNLKSHKSTRTSIPPSIIKAKEPIQPQTTTVTLLHPEDADTLEKVTTTIMNGHSRLREINEDLQDKSARLKELEELIRHRELSNLNASLSMGDRESPYISYWVFKTEAEKLEMEKAQLEEEVKVAEFTSKAICTHAMQRLYRNGKPLSQAGYEKYAEEEEDSE